MILITWVKKGALPAGRYTRRARRTEVLVVGQQDSGGRTDSVTACDRNPEHGGRVGWNLLVEPRRSLAYISFTGPICTIHRPFAQGIGVLPPQCVDPDVCRLPAKPLTGSRSHCRLSRARPGCPAWHNRRRRLPGGSSARLALIRHDLHEGDARGAVNADVDELPANAEMPVDRACPPSSDAMPHLD